MSASTIHTTQTAMEFELPAAEDLIGGADAFGAIEDASAAAADAAEAGDEEEWDRHEMAQPESVEAQEPPPAEPTQTHPAESSESSEFQRAYTRYFYDLERWQEERSDAEHTVSQAVIAVEQAKQQTKLCREVLKEATEALLGIEAREPKWPELKTESTVETTDPPAACAEAASRALADDLANHDAAAWRSIPIQQIDLTGIKGLGKKKLEALTAACPTVGDLEDLRAKGSGKGIGLRSIKGIGEEAAQAIEDAVLAWLTANRDSEVFSYDPGWSYMSDEAVDKEADGMEPPAAASLADVSAPSPLSTSSPAGIAAYDPDAQRAAMIEDRANRLLIATQPLVDCKEPIEDLEPHCPDDRYWNGGVEAFDRGVPVRDCPIDPPGAEQDDWIRGWLTAKLDDEGRQAAVKEATTK